MTLLEILIPIVLLLILLALGTPVGFAMAAAGAVGLWMIAGSEMVFAFFAITPHGEAASGTLAVIPAFILMAEFLGESTIVSRLFRTARAWFGWMPGGLAAATIAAGAGMGAMSGSSMATASSLARVTVPEMRAIGYDDKISLGSVATTGVLAGLIPPSVVLLVYGTTTETSIAGLFLAGIGPGILLTILFVLTILLWAAWNHKVAPRVTGIGWTERGQSLVHTLPPLLLIALVLGGLYSGLVTATEAGGLGAIGALIIAVVFGGLRWAGIIRAIKRTVTITAAIFIIIIGAKLFAQYIALTGVTQSLSAWVEELAVAPGVVILVMMIIYIIMGMFMDALGMMLLTLPVFFPLAMSLGFDPVWFGIMVVLVIELGLLTPPVGLNVFATVGALPGQADLSTAFRGAGRFYLATCGLLVLLYFVPEIALFIPSQS